MAAGHDLRVRPASDIVDGAKGLVGTTLGADGEPVSGKRAEAGGGGTQGPSGALTRWANALMSQDGGRKGSYLAHSGRAARETRSIAQSLH